MNKSIKVILIIICCLVMCITIILYFISKQGEELDRSSKKFIDSNIPKIISTWDYGIFCQYSHPDLLEKVNQDVFEKMERVVKANLGKFIKYKKSQGDALMKKSNKESSVTAKYISEIQYEKGNAFITTVLLYNYNKWYIISFDFKSDKLKFIGE